jgi:2-oxoglutarate ferredoxin oxidoreductase subunit alpha
MIAPRHRPTVTADPAGVLSGVHFLDGDHAACEGALAAGCRFVAGYPITPSTEVVERFAQRIPRVGDGVFIQMEDEIASSIAILGGAWAGRKVMTVTSGPGFSLMMEHIGLAAMTETPCVFVNVQRAGPSTGLPTQPAQGDMMQVKWGTHGDFEPIALVPDSPQECFDLTIKAFNLAELYRAPVFVMMDEVVGHMTERVVIPQASEIEIVERRWTTKSPSDYRCFKPEEGTLVPEMVKAGDGYRIHVTGLTHDERGYPVMKMEAHEPLLMRLREKILSARDTLTDVREDGIEGAAIAVVAYGITARVASAAIEEARREGLRVGGLRLITAWPFPEAVIRRLAKTVRTFIVPELNLGQMVREVERAAFGSGAHVVSLPHVGGTVHDPAVILEAIREAARRQDAKPCHRRQGRRSSVAR